MKSLLSLLFLLCTANCFSQSVPDYSLVPVETAADCQKADSTVLQAANYLLSTPYIITSMDRLRSLQFIMKWMKGTPDHSFPLDEKIIKLSQGNLELLSLYMTCMAKYCIENKGLSKDPKAVHLHAIKLLLTYCENEKNNMKMSTELLRLSEAHKKGELAWSL